MSDLLTPILVAGYGRTGTTALMALLGTDARVAFDRGYPFESRYLTYLTKFALLASRVGPSPHFDPLQLHDYDDDRFGPLPWPDVPRDDGAPPLRLPPGEWLGGVWRAFAAAVRRRYPGATCYAEKVPAWLPAAVRGVLPCRVLHLSRDPRDVYLSARAFVQSRGVVGFGMDASTSEMDQARHTAHGLVSFAENERADGGRADAMLVRYEDWAERPTAVVERLNTFLGLDLTATADGVTRHLDTHRTSADPEASVGRWRREPLPPAVRDCLEAHLAGPMAEYGYEPSPGSRRAAERVPDPGMPFSGGALTRTGDGATVRVTDGDFWVELPPGQFRADDVAEVWFCLRGATGDHCSVYWRGPREPFAEGRSVHVPFRPGRHWQVLRFRVGAHPLWHGIVEQVRLDLFNGVVAPGAGGEVRWVRFVA
jgi:hypothetical protein